ncbi:MAG: hypothetical protein KDB25_10285, partial [Leucobacter sp.]|nr:hypothetical protein [Leucobacter sp.]
MNEDELRAFLESASAGERGRGARPAGGTTPPEPGSAADVAAPSPQLAPTEQIQVPPEASVSPASVPPASVPSATEPRAAEPSFDEIMGGGEPSLTPIVLPGPPVANPVFPSAAGARREPVEPAAAPAQPAPPAARP